MHTLSIIKNPAGTYSFVGRVPVSLAYDVETDTDRRNIAMVGPGMAESIARKHGRRFRLRRFETANEAADFARSHGYEPRVSA